MSETASFEARLREALHDVVDPELGIDIVELGLVYRMAIDDGNVELDLGMTAPSCPFGDEMALDARRTLQLVPGVRRADVRIVLDPAWHPGLMSDEARRLLGWR